MAESVALRELPKRDRLLGFSKQARFGYRFITDELAESQQGFRCAVFKHRAAPFTSLV
ncbi:hypothetical protein [Mycobacteroides salmoniphilum]|uniref:hypothetical protein n=1 Tax=Mycobacteroides salmoniphilum TaxID=404941 RepID=UPI0012FFBC24|nr:hypothetical protein [Mycobacteroides salmoniphilum]